MRPIVCVISFALGTSSPILNSTLAQSDQAKPDRANDATPTAQDQSNAPADLKLTQTIRQSLVKDASLSRPAKNLKVITRNGKVTLRGTAQSAEEKARILKMATERAGGDANVADHIDVKAESTPTNEP